MSSLVLSDGVDLVPVLPLTGSGWTIVNGSCTPRLPTDALCSGGRVTLALNGLLHVEVPVTDVGRSARWYMRLFDLELMDEFCEQGIVHERFTGVAFGADGVSELHDAPKLDVS